MISITKNTLICVFFLTSAILFAIQMWDAIGPDSCF